MNDKWLKDIHDRMANYEADPPEDLWKSIQQRLNEAEAPKQSRRRRTIVVPVWARRAAGVAAMVAVAWMVGYQYIANDTQREHGKALPVLASSPIATDENTPAFTDEAASSESIDNQKKAVRLGQQRLAAIFTKQNNNTYVAETLATPGDTTNLSEEKHNRQTEEKPATTTKEQPTTKQKKSGYTRQQPIYVAEAFHRRGNQGRISLGAFSNGSTRGFSFEGAGDAAVVGSNSPDDATWVENPMLGLMASNQGRHVETTTKHHLPARLGLTVAYNLNDRLALETGLAYACLTSDSQSGSKENYLQSSQRLEYVGIPLNAKYRLASYKALQVYASAGVLTEKCVSGTKENAYVFEGRVEATEEESIDKKPFQFSANAGVGVQVNLTKTIGIYAEPGVSFHFDDGTDLNTFYSDHPVGFNLNLGVRLNLGKL